MRALKFAGATARRTAATAAVKFDPARPVPPYAIHESMSRGAGQAAPRRLAVSALLGSIGATGILLLARDYWMLAMPLACLATFGIYGLAAQRTDALNVLGLDAPMERRTLSALRGAARVIGVAAAAVSIVGALLALMRPTLAF